ncbi:MAG: molybdopterin-dependent oxidoreductase [Desulfobacterales bacterium]|nr:MAG: molybdopterin-dependent oxidoreductase [Desulfobacterales bacterium]
MASVNITLNGQKIAAQAGQTVLEAAQAAGVDIPTLCHHPVLKPIGACRVCLVEVKGQRSLQPACTFPVADRMEVQTESPKVVQARKFILELIFSERNHFCMYCEMSGDCELQALGYRYGLDHWVHPTYTQNFPVDASADDFLLDHNRCVLCRRCVRACRELVANHTLDLRQRGALTMLSADMDVALAESSCVACGVCLDVCPTGALIDKRSAFMARADETERIQSICSQCSLGCGIEIVARRGHVLRIEGQWDAPVSGGLLCQRGRFQALNDRRPRIHAPLLRANGRQIEVSWERALQAAAQRLAQANPQRLGVLTTTQATNEALHLLKKLFGQVLQAKYTGFFNKVVPRLSSAPSGSLADLSASDCILVVGADPVKEQPVAAFMIKRAADRESRLIVVENQTTPLSDYADTVLPLNAIEQAVAMALKAERPVVLYGAHVTAEACRSLAKLDGRAPWVALQPGVNTYAADALGFGKYADTAALDVAFVLAGEEGPNLTPIEASLRNAASIVVQASYASPLTDRADVVLPMATWLERSGTLTNTTGCMQKACQAKEPEGEAKPDWEILGLLAEKLDRSFQVAVDEIAPSATRVWQ